MNRLLQVAAACRPYVERGIWLASAATIWVATSPLAMAAKKKAVAEEAPSKSYVMPYFIVIMLIGLGMMAVLRPGKRADRPDDKKRGDGE